MDVGNEPDTLYLRLSRHALSIRVLFRASGFLRDVREAIRRAHETGAPSEYVLFAAPALTDESRRLLRDAGIAYMDAQGNFFLAASDVLLSREPGAPRPKPARDAGASVFRGRAAQVLHALLQTPHRQWHVTALAAEARVAPGTALAACETLEKMLLLRRDGRGPRSLRTLDDPGGLLGAWAKEYRPDYTTHSYFRWTADLGALTRQIGGAIEAQGGQYAATGATGAALRAPLLTRADQVALVVTPGVRLSALAADCRLTPAPDGANVILLVPKTEAAFLYRQRVDDLWVASDIALYLDLFASPGRGK